MLTHALAKQQIVWLEMPDQKLAMLEVNGFGGQIQQLYRITLGNITL